METLSRSESMPVTSERTLRRALGHFCSGVTVIAANDGGTPVGMTCQSFFSVSLDPPLVAFSVARSSTTFPVIRRIGACCVNVLARDQCHLSDAFARSGPDKLTGVKWSSHSGAFGGPVIVGSLAAFECDIVIEHAAGDHDIVVAFEGQQLSQLGAAARQARTRVVHQAGGEGRGGVEASPGVQHAPRGGQADELCEPPVPARAGEDAE